MTVEMSLGLLRHGRKEGQGLKQKGKGKDKGKDKGKEKEKDSALTAQGKKEKPKSEEALMATLSTKPKEVPVLSQTHCL